MGRVEGGAVHLTAMHPEQRCTPESVAGHALYERQDPFREHVAGGYVDMSRCVYTQMDRQTTKASGAVFVESPACKVKLEGAGKVGERRLCIIGIRDPETTARIDRAVGWSREKLKERFGSPGERYDVFFHVYGRNGVMKDFEPAAPARPHELCAVVEAISRDADLAEEVAALASPQPVLRKAPRPQGHGRRGRPHVR